MSNAYQINKSVDAVQDVYQTISREVKTICSLTVGINSILKNYKECDEEQADPDVLEDAVTISQLISDVADMITADAYRLLSIRQEIKRELGPEYADETENEA